MSKLNQAIHLLMDDHKRIKGLFRQFEAVDKRAPEMKEGVCRQIYMELEVHSQIEEKLVYPTIQSAFESESDKALVSDALTDHRHQRFWLKELKSASVDEERFNAKFNEVIQEIELHITREENEIFPLIENQVDKSVLEQMADQIFRMRDELIHQPQYKDSRPAQVQDPNGGEQKRLKSVA
jgi:hemerythrin-like domain-containing protein